MYVTIILDIYNIKGLGIGGLAGTLNGFPMVSIGVISKDLL